VELFNALPSSPVLSPRHAVLGTPIDAAPVDGQQVVHFAAGCFWGVEKAMWSVPGVIATATGYMGGHCPNPSYEQVCAHGTGHAEAVRVVFDAVAAPFGQLVALFFEIHDPTQADGQGNDLGDQYRSAIWTTTADQFDIASRTRDAFQRELAAHGFGAITTSIAPTPASPHAARLTLRAGAQQNRQQLIVGHRRRAFRCSDTSGIQVGFVGVVNAHAELHRHRNIRAFRGANSSGDDIAKQFPFIRQC